MTATNRSTPAAMRAREEELREQVLAPAARALAAGVTARQARQAATETRNHAREMRERSHELMRVGSELRERVTEYASTLQALGKPPATAIEAVRDIAEAALADARLEARVDRSDREMLEGELVLWTIDAYLAA